MLAGASLAIGLFSWYKSYQQEKKHNKLIKNLSTFKEHASGLAQVPMLRAQNAVGSTGYFSQWPTDYNTKSGKGIVSEYPQLIYDSTIIFLKRQTYFNEGYYTEEGKKSG